MTRDDILDYFEEDGAAYRGAVIAIKYFYFESQARLYAARLREAGIPCFVSNANTITAFPLGDGGIGLHVRAIDAESASGIIRELDSNDQTTDEDDAFREADHEDIAYQRELHEGPLRRQRWVLTAIAVIILLVILLRLLTGVPIINL